MPEFTLGGTEDCSESNADVKYFGVSVVVADDRASTWAVLIIAAGKGSCLILIPFVGKVVFFGIGDTELEGFLLRLFVPLA